MDNLPQQYILQSKNKLHFLFQVIPTFAIYFQFDIGWLELLDHDG